MPDELNCNYQNGALPSCAPLAVGFVPVQESADKAYDQNEALLKGTLFPGLDLPFMNYIADKPLPRTPQNELMALDFVCHELTLYLDTHPDDAEAFAAWKNFDAMAKLAHMRYVELYGSVQVDDTAVCSSWTWVNAPWPWENIGKGKA